MGSQPEVNVYSNRGKLSSALAAYVARQAAGAAARRGRFCVALSGGSLMDIIGPPLAKAKILSRVFNPNGKKPLLPSQLVNPSNGQLGWFLDRAAAADLF